MYSYVALYIHICNTSLANATSNAKYTNMQTMCLLKNNISSYNVFIHIHIFIIVAKHFSGNNMQIYHHHMQVFFVFYEFLFKAVFVSSHYAKHSPCNYM